MATAKVLYKSEPVSNVGSLEELLAYVRRELESIEVAFLNTLPKEVEMLHAEPVRVKEGLIVGADGSDWDPGGGQGVYAYYNSTWNKLG